MGWEIHKKIVYLRLLEFKQVQVTTCKGDHPVGKDYMVKHPYCEPNTTRILFSNGVSCG